MTGNEASKNSITTRRCELRVIKNLSAGANGRKKQSTGKPLKGRTQHGSNKKWAVNLNVGDTGKASRAQSLGKGKDVRTQRTGPNST